MKHPVPNQSLREVSTSNVFRKRDMDWTQISFFPSSDLELPQVALGPNNDTSTCHN